MRNFHVLLNITCKASQCIMEKNLWTHVFNNWLTLPWQHNLHKPFPVIAEFFTIPLYKTFSFQSYSWDVWCKSLSWGHAKASQSSGGQGSDWASTEGMFIYVEVILLLIYSCAVSLCLIASQNICWASVVDRWLYILLQNAQINMRINFSVDDSKMSWSWHSKSTSMMTSTSSVRFECWYIALCVECWYIELYKLFKHI